MLIERDRRQVFGRGPHHLPADRSRTGEEQMIEGQANKGACNLHPAGDDGDLRGIITLSDHDAEQLGKRGVSSEGLSIARLPAAMASSSGEMVNSNG